MPANDKCVQLPVFTGWLQVNRGNPAICDVFKVFLLIIVLHKYMLMSQIFISFGYKCIKCYLKRVLFDFILVFAKRISIIKKRGRRMLSNEQQSLSDRASLLQKASLTMPPDPPSLPNRASSFPPVSGPGSASSCSSGGSPLWSELISRSWLTSTPSRSPGPHLPPPPLSEIATGFSSPSVSPVWLDWSATD